MYLPDQGRPIRPRELACRGHRPDIITSFPRRHHPGRRPGPRDRPSGRIVQLSSDLAAALGEERVGELHARGADMSWDQAIAYTLTQITQALNELESGTQP